MSDYLKSAVVTASASVDDALTMLEDSLHVLASDYQFEFRGGYGELLALEFNAGDYVSARALERPATIADLDAETLAALARAHRGFQIVGSLRFPDEDRLYDAALGIYPVFEQSGACLVSHLDAKLYTELWSEDDLDFIDLDVVEKLRTLAVTLGAHTLADGFCTQNVDAIGDIVTFDGARLRDSFVNPGTVHEKWKDRTLLRHGIVSGIKRELCSIGTMRALGEGCDVFETITGHVVLSALVEVDPSLSDDLDDLDD